MRNGKFLKVMKMNVLQIETAKIAPAEVQRLTFTAPAKNSSWKKITAIRLANGNFQVEKLTEKQAFHEKISADANLFEHEIFSLFNKDFMQLEILTAEFSYRFKAAKKECFFRKTNSKRHLKIYKHHKTAAKIIS